MPSRLLARTITTIATSAAVVTAATLVAAPAQAGSGSTTYDCQFPVLGSVPVPVSGTIPDLPPVPAGSSVPAGSLDPTMVFSLTEGLVGVIGLVSGLGASGLDLGLDGGTVPVDGFTFGSLSGTSLPASASSGAFSAPAVPGDYPITMPSDFDIVGTLGGGAVTIPCLAQGLPAQIGTLVVAGDDPALSTSTTEAALVKSKIRRGKAAKVAVTVTLSPVPLPAMGDVVIKKGKKTIGRGTLESGAVTVKTTKKFKKPGSYTLKAKYLGEPPLVGGSTSEPVVLTVKKKRR